MARKFTTLVSVVLVVLLLLIIKIAGAQTARPQFLITWEAKSYAPAQYKGKILPTANSLITASFELIDGGKITDLANQTIYWYFNDDLISNTPGQQTVSFSAPDYAPSTARLRIQLPFYKGSLLIKEISIPVVSPEAVIESSYPGNLFGGTSINLKGVPYFFNVKSHLSLGFTWSVNGQTASSKENPDELIANLNADAAPGSTLNVGLTIQNPKNYLESATQNIGLTYTK